MATQYTLNFSDPSKTTAVIISGSTKNNYSTSLDLVGPGYVAYGETIAQDFLNVPISLGENLTEKIIGKITPDGEDMELNALAYDRVESPILWTVCKNLLARIEALESKLNSN